uniref:Putative ovule protein n=1 Tax=Solanum chacoense TaxID=4108 RepID=A0A0V0GK20_SOLCH
MEGKTEKENKFVRKTACDVEALKKCLEENKGDYLKCQSHVEAFRSSCSINNSNSSSSKLNSGADSDPVITKS